MIQVNHSVNRSVNLSILCVLTLLCTAQVYERMHQPQASPNPNNPDEYCTTIPPMQQALDALGAAPPSVMVPVGVLRKEGK